MAPKKKMAMVEGYGKNFERYKTVAQKKKHEREEPVAQLKMESKREKLIAKKRGKKK